MLYMMTSVCPLRMSVQVSDITKTHSRLYSLVCLTDNLLLSTVEHIPTMPQNSCPKAAETLTHQETEFRDQIKVTIGVSTSLIIAHKQCCSVTVGIAVINIAHITT